MPMSARELYASYQRGEIADLPAAVEEHMPAWQAQHEARMERMAPRGIAWGVVFSIVFLWLPVTAGLIWWVNR